MRPRARDLGIRIGEGDPGPLNALTDVAGVRVGHCTILQSPPGHADSHPSACTGVTVIEPRPGPARLAPCFAGVHVLNGNGDATGLEWIREAGLLTTPIALTNTHSVGTVRDALVAIEHEQQSEASATTEAVYWCMPVVMETYDGFLNDINGFHVRPEHVRRALAQATTDLPVEGAVGGGTGMICHEFKGGIGTASRRLPETQGGWTVGALVQANHGRRSVLRVAGYPVGTVLGKDCIESPFAPPSSGTPAFGPPGMGSIVVVLATDAPLLPEQCRRLAQRAGLGIARAGGGTEDSSGDLFVAFSTGNSGLPVSDYARPGSLTTAVRMVNPEHLSPLFAAAAEAVEESVINALLAAVDTVGWRGRQVRALPHPALLRALKSLGWQPQI